MSINKLNNADNLEQDKETSSRIYWKQRADLMGIEYANNIPTEKLKLLVQEKLAEPINSTTSSTQTVGLVDPAIIEMEDRATALVRFKLTVLDPEKANWSGMIVTVGNNNLLVSRAIYFIDEVWHAERIIIDHLKEMRYLPRHTVKSKHSSQMKETNPRRVKKLPCFHIEELPPLTEEELRSLAQRQIQDGTGRQED